MDVRALFPEREDEVDAEQAVAIDEVCARLGRPREWVADDGFEHTVVGGAIAGERVAWVERRSSGDEGWEDVDYFLRMRVGEVLVREWVVDTYNPYFGCDVGYLRWWGEEVVAIYREKHETIACALGSTGAPRMRPLAFAWKVLGDVVLYESEARGLVERVLLPEFFQGTPMGAATAAELMANGTCPRGQPIGTSPAALQRQIAERLPGLTGPVAELIVGATAYRFWDAWPLPGAKYEEVYSTHRWNPPCWLPFYCYCASSGAEARALLEQLDMVAARRPGEVDAESEAAELACRHIADRCRELAAACRAGHLPGDASCSFWVEWSQTAFSDAEALFPAGMWAAWQALRPRAREMDALARRR
ncbi:hypothetical protein [Nannocystis pusilla]|uniref:Uncharacterized protein n=1 Tax=Nannocystis pusilla TaxID=889268 RepID=A0ABS7TMS8_9BACT|nr:hypothetical protein [Nannocystis pusilla]MBZ5709528.1 hypothetical protein [Nannocystis pusilla]